MTSQLSEEEPLIPWQLRQEMVEFSDKTRNSVGSLPKCWCGGNGRVLIMLTHNDCPGSKLNAHTSMASVYVACSRSFRHKKAAVYIPFTAANVKNYKAKIVQAIRSAIHKWAKQQKRDGYGKA